MIGSYCIVCILPAAGTFVAMVAVEKQLYWLVRLLVDAMFSAAH